MFFEKKTEGGVKHINYYYHYYSTLESESLVYDRDLFRDVTGGDLFLLLGGLSLLYLSWDLSLCLLKGEVGCFILFIGDLSRPLEGE